MWKEALGTGDEAERAALEQRYPLAFLPCADCPPFLRFAGVATAVAVHDKLDRGERTWKKTPLRHSWRLPTGSVRSF